MSKKKVIKRAVISLMATTMLCGSFSIVTFATTITDVQKEHIQVQNVGDGDVSVMSNQLVWHVKTVNGVKYRRLWDATDCKWLTDWIRC